jgi:alpha,alpha-trehalase
MGAPASSTIISLPEPSVTTTLEPILPPTAGVHNGPVLAYINDFWPNLVRHTPADVQTLIGLPYPYVVPGVGAMFQEMYYWDSFFAGLGLVGTPHDGLVVDMAENMAWLIERFGMVPNGSRYYFLSRSQPPFFTQMVRLAYAVKQAHGEPAEALHAWLGRMLLLADREYEIVWRGIAQPHHRLVHEGMSRYFDINFLDMLASCESGWDHSTRCGDRWLSHLPVDLNAVLYQAECDMHEAAEIVGDRERAEVYSARAAERAERFSNLFWEPEIGFFLDYDFVNRKRNPTPSLAGFYPLWVGLATPEQAARIVAEWLPRFQQRGGLVTSLDQQEGRQWAWPNGWAPLQWIAAEGLDRYGFHAEAQRVRASWCATCTTFYGRTGVLWEKYNVVDPDAEGEAGFYGHVTGFGWTNGVFVDFARKLAPPPELPPLHVEAPLAQPPILPPPDAPWEHATDGQPAPPSGDGAP